MRCASFRYQASALANNSNITLTAAIKCEGSDTAFEEKKTLLETWYNKHQLNLVQAPAIDGFPMTVGSMIIACQLSVRCVSRLSA